jgi:hypothetical protein
LREPSSPNPAVPCGAPLAGPPDRGLLWMPMGEIRNSDRQSRWPPSGFEAVHVSMSAPRCELAPEVRLRCVLLRNLDVARNRRNA